MRWCDLSTTQKETIFDIVDLKPLPNAEQQLGDLKDFFASYKKVFNKKVSGNVGVYIGRPGVFGNPFPLRNETQRAQCLAEYYEWVRQVLLGEQRGPFTKEQFLALAGNDLTCFCHPRLCHGHIIGTIVNGRPHVGSLNWTRFGGYEVSSKGDTRFSAFAVKLEDGRTIEHHYQCDVKGYDPGGINWRLGKGKPALNPNTDLWEEYLGLWRRWASTNEKLIVELRWLAYEQGTKNGMLSDMFATTPINQAHALSVLANQYRY